MNTQLFLIRHGQPVLQNALLGSTDSPLSEIGWQQLESCFNNLAVADLDLLVSSPLSRCANFAQAFSADHQLELEINADWQECYFGDWDGKTYQQLHQLSPQALADFYNNPIEHTPPKGEKLNDFNQRIIQALLNLLKQHQGKKIVILAHAGVIRTLVAWCLKMDLTSGNQFKKFAIDYASISQITIYQSEHNGDKLEAVSSELTTSDLKTSTASLFAQLMKLNHVCY